MEANKAFVFSKAVTQFFNPDDFSITHQMDYTSQVVNYFEYQQTPWIRQLTYNIDQTTVNVNDEKLLDTGNSVQLQYYNF